MISQNKQKEISDLEQQIQEVQQRLEAIRHEPRLTLEQQAIAVMDLSSTLEELHVAAEEIVTTRQALERERQRYQELFEFAPDGYVITDEKAIIQEANCFASTFLNISKRYLVGKPLYIYVAELDRTSFWNTLDQLAHCQQLKDWIVKLTPRQGNPVPVSISVSAIRNPQGDIIGLRWLIRDIRQQIAAEKELKQYQDHLEEQVEGRTVLIGRLHQEIEDRKRAEAKVQHLNATLEKRVRDRTAQLEMMKDAAEVASRAKSKFLANMSHELRTPLTAILGFTQMLHRDPRLLPCQQDNLHIISRSGEHLLRLINDVLRMSKIESGGIFCTLENCNLYQLCEEVHEMLRFKAEDKGLQLRFQISPEVPKYVKTDANKLRQILINLLGNAIKFTQTGNVTLNLALGATPASAQTHLLHFNVEDTGCGIPSHEKSTMFEAFVQSQTGPKDGDGTGLGLSICKAFVNLLGGKISINSELGQGTTVYFDVLVEKGEAAPDLAHSLPQVLGLAGDQKIPRIIVAEDHLENRQLLMQLLQTIGFSVKGAENGQSTIALAQNWQPDLIWMDIRMPGLDGLEATRQIKAFQNPPVILALSANAFEEDKVLSLEAGCDDFVSKPFQENVILEKISKYLGVDYVYAESKPRQKTSRTPGKFAVGDLEVMPSPWVQELFETSLTLDEQNMVRLFEKIPAEHHALRVKLEDLVQNFRFDKIMSLSQKSLES